MGAEEKTQLKAFTVDSLHNRKLVITMLKHEDSLFMGSGQMLFKTLTKAIDPQLAMQRRVLSNFGFNNDDNSLNNYRKIVQVYWRGPDDYDKEVLDSVVYLRANKLLYYREPHLEIGDLAKDCRLLNLDGSETALSAHWLDSGIKNSGTGSEAIVTGIENSRTGSEAIITGIENSWTGIENSWTLVCAFSGS